MQQDKNKRIVIVGGGFAGLACALELAPHANVHVTLIDRNNYQQFNPLFYQVAAGILSPGNAAFALRDVLQEYKNIDVQMGEVVSVDLNSKTVTTNAGQAYAGDYLVLATGAAVNFFNTPGAEQFAYPLYSLQDAEHLRSAILDAFEQADADPDKRTDGALNFVVVGGGPTGVEMAGVLNDMTTRMMQNEFRNIRPSMAKVFLVERSPSLLRMFSLGSQSYASEVLQARGVELHLGAAVQKIDASGVLLSTGARIMSRTVIWAAGLAPRTLTTTPDIFTKPRARIAVNPDLSLPDVPGVYVVGDLASPKASDGLPLPQLAAVAKQEGQHCARNILAEGKGDAPTPFVYRDRGILAMVGRNAAVAELGSEHHRIVGPIAFVTWLGIHAALLTVNRARLEAVMEWAWTYFHHEHAAELIDRIEG
jgi:NADH dehydrogenase